MYTGASSNTILDYNLVRFGVCMIKLRHERMLILRCISIRQKNWITSRKNVTPPPPATTWKILNTLTRNSSHWEYLNPMRNLKLLEKYQPPPPPKHQRKRKSQSTRKRKNITPRKSFNHPKIASTIMKKTQTPHLKILNFSKTLTPSENFSTPLK